MDEFMMKIKNVSCAVLGASGFLGTNLCLQLLHAGAEIRAFDRQTRSAQIDLKDLHWIQGDFSDVSALIKAIRKCEVVFHLIDDSIPNTANKDPLNYINSNVINT